MSESSNVVPEEKTVTTSGRTRVESSRSLLKWDIQDFNVLAPNEAQMGTSLSQKDEFFSAFKALRSPIFTTRVGEKEGTKSEQEWFVELDINPKCKANTPLLERYVSLYLNYQPSDNCLIEPSRLVASFCILGRENREYLKHPFVTKFANIKLSGAGYLKYVPLRHLWENRNTYLVNNVLRIGVEVRAFGSTLTEIIDSGHLDCGISSGSQKLADDMRQLFKSGKDADITITCGGRDFPVHSAILKGRSIVIERMLESSIIESEEKIIKIEDVDPIILEAFLEYIYTAQVELNLESMDKAFGLVPVADKYGVEELKAKCFGFIVEHMSLTNAGEIAVLSYQHNAGEKLRSEVVNFCHANWSELAKMSTFKNSVSENPLAFFKEMPHE